MAIIKHKPHRVMPDGINRYYLDVFFAGLQYLLSRTMSLDVGRWRIYAQVLEREIERVSVIKLHRKQARCLAELYLDGSGAHLVLQDVTAEILVLRKFGKMIVDIARVDLDVRSALVGGLEGYGFE